MLVVAYDGRFCRATKLRDEIASVTSVLVTACLLHLVLRVPGKSPSPVCYVVFTGQIRLNYDKHVNLRMGGWPPKMEWHIKILQPQLHAALVNRTFNKIIDHVSMKEGLTRRSERK